MSVLATNGPQSYTLDLGGLPIQQAQNLDWNTLGNWNPDGDAASNSAPSHPYSTYTVVPGARLRSPPGAANSIFPGFFTPGIQVIVAGPRGCTHNPHAARLRKGAIRFHHTHPGTNHFKQTGTKGGPLGTQQ